MSERIIINYLMLRGVPDAITAARTRLLGDNKRSPLAGYICRICTDQPCSLRLSWASRSTPTAEEIAALVACAPGLATHCVFVDLLRCTGQSRVFGDNGCVEVADLPPEAGLRWLLGEPGLPPIIPTPPLPGGGGPMDPLAKRVKAAE
jgi:hypothetical protein